MIEKGYLPLYNNNKKKNPKLGQTNNRLKKTGRKRWQKIRRPNKSTKSQAKPFTPFLCTILHTFKTHWFQKQIWKHSNNHFFKMAAKPKPNNFFQNAKFYSAVHLEGSPPASPAQLWRQWPQRVGQPALRCKSARKCHPCPVLFVATSVKSQPAQFFFFSGDLPSASPPPTVVQKKIKTRNKDSTLASDATLAVMPQKRDEHQPCGA